MVGIIFPLASIAFLFIYSVVDSTHECAKKLKKKIVLKQLLIIYTFLNQMRIGKNIRHKEDRMKPL